MNVQYCACRTDALRIFVRSLIAPAPPQWRKFSGLAGRQSRSSGLLRSTTRRMDAVASLSANENMQVSGVRYYARRSSRRADPEPMMTSTDAFLDAMEGRPAQKKGQTNKKNNRMDKLGGGRSNKSNRSNRSGGTQDQRTSGGARDFPVVTLESLDAKKAPVPPAKTLPPFTLEKAFTDRDEKKDDDARQRLQDAPEEPTPRVEKPKKQEKPQQVEKLEEKVKKRGPWVNDRVREDHDDVRSMSYEPDQPPRTQLPPQSEPRARTPPSSPLVATPRPPMRRPPPDAEPWRIQKYALQQKFPEGWNPRKKLSPDAHDGIRALHKQFPETYTTKALSDHFKVSPEAIRRILKSQWRATAEEEEDRQQRWFERGKQVWSRWAELGRKPPKRWQAEGIRRDASWAGKRQRQQDWRAEMGEGGGEGKDEGMQSEPTGPTKMQSQGKRMRLQQGLDRGAEASA